MCGGNCFKKKVLLDPERTKFWYKKISRIDPFEVKMKNFMDNFFTKQKKEIVKNILNQKSEVELLAIQIVADSKNTKIHLETEGVVFDFEKWKAELQEASEPELATIIEELAQDVMNTFADSNAIDMSLPNVRNEIGRRARDMSNFVNSTTNREIKKLLEKAEAERLSINDKANLIGDWFDDISPGRAQRIARTETFGAANYGTQEGIHQAGLNGKQWITSRDERVRYTHQIDGDVVPVDGEFMLNDGSMVAYPQDVNERCVLAPYRISPTEII